MRNAQTPIERKPEWIKTRAKMGPEYTALHSLVKDEGLHTVCQEAGCPNIYECWEDREATFLIGGSQCTRRCDFCQIDTGKPADYDTDEPRRVAESVVKMRLRYATVTGVARDDLPDEGAWLHAETVRRIHAENPGTGVEILATDFSGNPTLLREVFESRPEVFAHNVETVPRIFKRIRPAFRYERSLDVLTQARDFGLITKSNLILGMGEEPHEVVQALQDLHDAGTDIITITQYLRPSPRHLPVDRWVKPDEFVAFKEEAERIGFLGVLAGPLVRSSYRAGRLWAQSMISKGRDIPEDLAHLAQDIAQEGLAFSQAVLNRRSVGAGDRQHVAVGVEVHEDHVVGRVGVERVLEHRERVGAAVLVGEDRHAHELQRPDDVDLHVARDVDQQLLELVAEALLLLEDVLDHFARAVIELGDHGVAGGAVDRLDRRDQAGRDIQRGLRHVVLIGRGQIDRHGLIAEVDVLGPEDRPVRARLQESEEVVLDRHIPMKPARGHRRHPVTARRRVTS